jgi:hypothetical protein
VGFTKYILELVRDPEKFESNLKKLCNQMHKTSLFNLWKKKTLKDSKLNVELSIIIPFCLRNCCEPPLQENQLYKFFILFNECWDYENKTEFTESSLNEFEKTERE